MKLTLPFVIAIFVTTSLIGCKSELGVNSSPSVTDSKPSSPPDSTIMAAIYGKAAGDSAVYDKGNLVESSSSDREISAKLLQKQIFQRHDSILCLVTTKNEFGWGAGVHSGWIDAALFRYIEGAWKLVKIHRQAAWGGAFGVCDCRVQAQQLNLARGKKLLVFVRSNDVHQGEYEYCNVITEDLLTSNNSFTTYASGNMDGCSGEVNVDSLKTGFFVKHISGQDDQVELVSYEEQKKNQGCVGVYKKKYFTYDQLLEEIKKPHMEAE